MEHLLQQIEKYKQEITAFVAAGAEEVEQFRIKWLGTKGLVKSIMGEMKNVPNDQKKSFGQLLNEFKSVAEAKLEVLQQSHSPVTGTNAPAVDYALPGDPVSVGSRHPLTLVRNEMVTIFKRLGFAVAEGP